MDTYGTLGDESKGLEHMARKKALEDMAGDIDRHISSKVTPTGTKRELPKQEVKAEESLLPLDFDERLQRFMK